jgi:hydrogenase/urease accessory protein HupE
VIQRLLLILTCLWAWTLAAPACAHEVRPAYLDIHQVGPRAYTVLWKQPIMGDVAIHLTPHMSNGWLERAPSDQFATGAFLVRTWQVTDADRSPAGVQISIEGLPETITDVLVRVRLTGVAEHDEILRPARSSLTIATNETAGLTTPAFFRLGVEHILRGPDHMLFVLGLLLIVSDRRKLIKTITAFTVAHSITLAVATLGGVSLPVPLLNALIALSIVFMGVEAARARAGGDSLTLRHPWVAAFGFGLLHGFGFASGLTGLGLTQGALAAALLLFNLGVEAGQLAFIAVVLALKRAFRLMEVRWAPAAMALPTYAIGVMGAVWTFQYLSLLFI